MNRALLMAALGAAAVASSVWIAPPEFLAGYFTEADATPRPPAAKTPETVTEAVAGEEFAPVNPLHAITVEQMNAMVERPLFNQTRAPPPPPVEEAPPEAVAESEPQVVEDTTGPQDFTLLGVSINGGERFALVRYNKTNEVFRLKSGQYLSDWELRSVESKEIVIARADSELTIRLFDASRAAPPPVDIPPEVAPEEGAPEEPQPPAQ